MKQKILAGLLAISFLLSALPAAAAPAADEDAPETALVDDSAPVDQAVADQAATDQPAAAEGPAPADQSQAVADSASAPATEAPAAPSAEVRINMADNRYVSGNQTVAVGTTVTWVNNGSNIHTISDNNGTFDSGSVNHGATYSHTFTAPGTYRYICRQHALSGMMATITVQ